MLNLNDCDIYVYIRGMSVVSIVRSFSLFRDTVYWYIYIYISSAWAAAAKNCRSLIKLYGRDIIWDRPETWRLQQSTRDPARSGRSSEAVLWWYVIYTWRNRLYHWRRLSMCRSRQEGTGKKQMVVGSSRRSRSRPDESKFRAVHADGR